MRNQTVKFIAIWMTFSLIMSFSIGITDTKSGAAENLAVKSVTVTNAGKKLLLLQGKSFRLKTKIVLKKKQSASKKLLFQSSKKAVATVNSAGVVKAKKPGSTKITVQSKVNPKKKAIVNVVVKKNIPISSISLDETSLTLYTVPSQSNDEIVDEYELTAVVTPSNATNQNLEWSSSNPDIADVDNDGYVMTMQEGTTVIKVSAKDGSGVKALCTVTVIDNSEEDDEENDADFDYAAYGSK